MEALKKIYDATFCQLKNLVATKKLIKIQARIPMKLKFKVNKDMPSFAISRIEEAITLKGRAWAKGWISDGKDEIGKKTPERINWGSVKSNAIGRIASWVLAKLPRKNPIHKKIIAPRTMTPNSE